MNGLGVFADKLECLLLPPTVSQRWCQRAALCPAECEGSLLTLKWTREHGKRVAVRCSLSFRNNNWPQFKYTKTHKVEKSTRVVVSSLLRYATTHAYFVCSQHQSVVLWRYTTLKKWANSCALSAAWFETRQIFQANITVLLQQNTDVENDRVYYVGVFKFRLCAFYK